MENIEFLQAQLSLAGEIAVSHKNNILTDRIFLQISGRKQISAQPVINGTTVLYSTLLLPTSLVGILSEEHIRVLEKLWKNSNVSHLVCSV